MLQLPREIIATPAGRFEVEVAPYGMRKARFYARVYALTPVAGRFATVARTSCWSGLDGMGRSMHSTPAAALESGRAYIEGMVV